VNATRARFTFTDREVALVSRTGPTSGRAAVYVDGVRYRTVDLYAVKPRPRTVVFHRAWLEAEEHRVVVRALGTKSAASGGTRVDVDAFAVVH
jgi:alpha-L-fucosidase 2